MSNWKKVRLGEVCTTNASILSVRDNWRYINYLDTGNITNNQINSIQNLVIGKDEIPSRAKRRVIANDIVFSTVRPNQRHYGFIKEPLKNMVVSTGFTTITSNTKKAVPKFIYYFLSQNEIIDGLQAIAEQSVSTYPSLKPSDIESLHIALPPLAEQQRIARILGALDDKIECNNRINRNLEEQAAALFRRWFVDFEFPDFDGKPYRTSGGKMQDSSLGKIPQGWQVSIASDYFNISIGKTPPRAESHWFSRDNKDVIWVSIANMGNSGVYINDSSEYLTAESIKKFNVVLVPSNTVILSFKLTVGRVAITNGITTTNEAIAHFKTDKVEVTEYLYLLLKTYDYQSMGSTSSIATAVNSKMVKAMMIMMPSMEVLSMFHKIISPIFGRIKANQTENQTLTTLRDTLLPKLMNNEI